MTKLISFTMAIMLSAFVFTIGAVNADPVAEPGRDDVAWLTLDKDAFVKAQRIYTPVLMFVTADWCRFCKAMDKETFQNPQVAKYIKQNFVPVVANADDVALLKRYNITALPAIIILDIKGNVIDEFSGFRDTKFTMKVLMHAYRQSRMT